MFGYNDLSIDFLTGSPVFVSIALVVLVGLAVFSYMRTNPPLSKYLKIILAGLRTIAIVALILALFEPVFSYNREYDRSKNISIMIDRSDSMNRVEKEKTRRARVDSLLSSEVLEDLEDNSNVKKYQFAGLLSTDDENIESDKTAIGEALYEIERLEVAEPVDYRILFSDGGSNYGRQAIEAAGKVKAPIIAIDMSAGSAEFDIAVTNVNFNAVVFAGQPTEIKVKLGWQGELNQSVPVRLLDSNRVVAEQKFSASQEGGQAEVSLRFTPDRPGQKILRVSVPAQENESTDRNNSRSFAIKILKSKMSVLLVTAHPDYDVGFLKRFFDNSDRYEVSLVATGRKSGNLSARFPKEQTEINRYDMIILHDPDPAQIQQYAEIIKSYLNDRGGSLWVLMGEKFARSKANGWMNEILPFSQSGANNIVYRQFHVEPVEGNLLHPSNRIDNDQQSIRQAWSKLPPFESLVRCDLTASDATILSDVADISSLDRRWPVTGFRRQGPGKVFACAALPFWSWKFLSISYGGGEQYFTKFVEGTSSWLTVAEDIDPVRIRPVKQVFSRGETVRFDGFAYDLGFRPIPGVSGNVQLDGPGNPSTVTADLIPEDEGKFAAEFFNLSAGKHKWTGKFEKDGRVIKEVSGEILVESFTLEEFDQGGTAAMTTIASQSGGQYFRFDQFDRAMAMIDTEPVLVAKAGEIVLWGKLWLLILFIAALSVEWLLRKVFQLI